MDGVIDFHSHAAELILEQVAQMLLLNEESDFYAEIDGIDFAFNASFWQDRDTDTPWLEVLLSEIEPNPKNRRASELWGICVLRLNPTQDGTVLYTPFMDDDDKTTNKAKAIQRSIERTLGITIDENDTPDQ